MQYTHILPRHPHGHAVFAATRPRRRHAAAIWHLSGRTTRRAVLESHWQCTGSPRPSQHRRTFVLPPDGTVGPHIRCLKSHTHLHMLLSVVALHQGAPRQMTLLEDPPPCPLISSSSSSSLKFLEWPKQQRHHEDHYRQSKYEQYQTVLICFASVIVRTEQKTKILPTSDRFICFILTVRQSQRCCGDLCVLRATTKKGQLF